MVEFTEETKNNEYVFIEKSASVIKEIAQVNGVPTEIPLLQVYISKEAVEVLKQAESCAVDRYGSIPNPDHEIKEAVAFHTKITDELMEVRNYLSP